ncbi:MAG: hypothetical protein U5J97_05160 [Trueperaceae bacterium]|nr:hypothetical protein [Trueperaceae bacterium]
MRSIVTFIKMEGPLRATPVAKDGSQIEARRRDTATPWSRSRDRLQE